MSKSLETLIDHMGVLYKFHDRPISYLYNTLHYYEVRVRDRAMLKKKMISNIVGKYNNCVNIYRFKLDNYKLPLANMHQTSFLLKEPLKTYALQDGV